MFILLLLFICPTSGDNFSPDSSDYNAYGLKMAANDLMIVEAQNDYSLFLVQFPPYTDNITQTSQDSCLIQYDDTSWYIYTVAVGKKQSTYYFFFVGEMINLDKDTSLPNRTFVGILDYTGSLVSIVCDNNFYYYIQYIDMSFPHQERLVMTTDLFGLFAYGFSKDFTFSYAADTANLIVNPTNSLSPSTEFLPSAVDYDGKYGIIAGFFSNGQNARM